MSSKSKVAAGGRRRVIFFGDSVCSGQHVSVDQTFVTGVAAHWHRHHQPVAIFENRSVNGQTTRQALERLAFDVTSHSPDLVYVQFGINDCNIWETDFGIPRVPIDAYEANLREIVAKIRASGTEKTLLATNHRCLLGETYETRLLAYNEIARKVAREAGCRLVDIGAASSEFDVGTMLLPDGVHLSASGHAFYLERLKAVIVDEMLALTSAFDGAGPQAGP